LSAFFRQPLDDLLAAVEAVVRGGNPYLGLLLAFASYALGSEVATLTGVSRRVDQQGE
jgi:hypothetical protein